MVPFGCACAASLAAPSPGMNESEKSCVLSLLWVQFFNPWLQVFPCGCKFSTCRIDKMKSCHHKETR